MSQKKTEFQSASLEAMHSLAAETAVVAESVRLAREIKNSPPSPKVSVFSGAER